MTIHIADCLDALSAMDAESVDAVITDPPYGIGFMGHEWDKPALDERSIKSSKRPQDGGRFIGNIPKATKSETLQFQNWCEAWASECLRVLKPGGYIAAFGATRLYHRLTVAIEDAGFEIRDSLAWLYGSGFPKSKNDGPRGTALKPAWEPIVLAQKNKGGTFKECYERHGTGYLNIDDARVPLINGESKDVNDTFKEKSNDGWGMGKHTRAMDSTEGRWPANVATDGSESVQDPLPYTKTGAWARKEGQLRGETSMFGLGGIGSHGASEGNASRFFYTAKPSTAEKEAGLDGFRAVDAVALNKPGNEDFVGNGFSCSGNSAKRNTHATVKPIELMRWIIRLIAPPGGLILDPFLGSGTTAIAAVLEDRRWIGIEREKGYAAIAEARIEHWTSQHKTRPGRDVKTILKEYRPKEPNLEQADMFA